MMFIINGAYIFNAEQGFIDSQETQVRHPIGVNEIALLNYMIMNGGKVLTKDELMHEVWHKRGILVEHSSLLHSISNCRRALEGRGNEVIRTVRGTGYEFVGRVIPAESVESPSRASAEPAYDVLSSSGQTHILQATTLGIISKIQQYYSALGLFFLGTLASYMVTETLRSPVDLASFTTHTYSVCRFLVQEGKQADVYNNAVVYDFGQLHLIVDGNGRSLSFNKNSGVVDCE
ncbi:winged helix-turn-helix domain-containing protein [Vibrio ostreicida]|uniref:winged helix-turn-helix domain-containing protein n=1 Tax=Vibrio ostreicida TaxID=526588 RepID=UPI001FE7BA29|nr:winged helix-turn-helix domain-containing protein [Vibrio ostreicida]